MKWNQPIQMPWLTPRVVRWGALVGSALVIVVGYVASVEPGTYCHELWSMCGYVLWGVAPVVGLALGLAFGARGFHVAWPILINVGILEASQVPPIYSREGPAPVVIVIFGAVFIGFAWLGVVTGVVTRKLHSFLRRASWR